MSEDVAELLRRPLFAFADLTTVDHHVVLVGDTIDPNGSEGEGLKPHKPLLAFPLRDLAAHVFAARFLPVLPAEWRGGLVEAPSLWLVRPTPCQVASRLISLLLVAGTTRVASSTMSRRSPFDWTSTLRR